ncbi:MAG: adenosylmethionine decarboxylase [Candidatus Sumerlaeota bacterium]
MEQTNTVNTESYCGHNDHMKYAGVHLIVELWQCNYLTDATKIRSIILDAVNACGATLLSMDLHVFSPNGGVSGVAVLQESHISIHTWPEYEYAAMDIFVCGTLDPYEAIPVLKDGFQPGKVQVVEMKRGIF